MLILELWDHSETCSISHGSTITLVQVFEMLPQDLLTIALHSYMEVMSMCVEREREREREGGGSLPAEHVQIY